MSTLLLRLAGPMQSWGTQSRFIMRDTGLEPSKSGVVGLLCAALGRSRTETVDDLASLKMGVRADFEGAMKVDFQTAGGIHRKGERYGVVRASGKVGETVISNCYYLADADFLVGLEGDEDLLITIQHALVVPRWQLSLGRKAFVPGVPPYIPDGLHSAISLIDALTAHPWPAPYRAVPPESRRPPQLRMVIEDPDEGYEVHTDQPHGSAFQHRRFLPRFTFTRFLELGKDVPIRDESEEESHVPVTTAAESA